MQQIMPGATHWTKKGQNNILTGPSLIAVCPLCPEWSSSLVEEKVGCDEVIKDHIRRHIRQEVELKLLWQPLFWQFLLLLLDFAALMMMYEFTAAYPTGWIGPQDCPIILRGDGHRHLHHVGWSWGMSSCVWAQSDWRQFYQGNSAFQVLSPILTLKSCVQRLCGLMGSDWYRPRDLLLSGTCCVGVLLSHWIWDVLPSPPHTVFQKNSSTLLSSAFRIFEVSPTSGSAFFDLAMTDLTAGSEASWEWSHLSALYRWLLLVILQGLCLPPSPAHFSQT